MSAPTIGTPVDSIPHSRGRKSEFWEQVRIAADANPGYWIPIHGFSENISTCRSTAGHISSGRIASFRDDGYQGSCVGGVIYVRKTTN